LLPNVRKEKERDSLFEQIKEKKKKKMKKQNQIGVGASILLDMCIEACQ
jgi:hypothetical protein